MTTPTQTSRSTYLAKYTTSSQLPSFFYALYRLSCPISMACQRPHEYPQRQPRLRQDKEDNPLLLLLLLPLLPPC